MKNLLVMGIIITLSPSICAMQSSAEKSSTITQVPILPQACGLIDASQNNKENYHIRPLREKDIPQIKDVILVVRSEFGFGQVGQAHKSSHWSKKEFQGMYKKYSSPKSAYFVVVHKETSKIVGGAGFGLLKGVEDTVEIKGMYLAQKARGLGIGKLLLDILIEKAQQEGYKTAYLETHHSLERANKLYATYGFKLLDQPLGTGPHTSTRWYTMELNK